MEHTMNTEVQEMGYMLKQSIQDEVFSGQVFEDGYANRILGYHHDASQWVDLDHEDSPMKTDTSWYLSTDGDLELETEIGRLYLTTLDDEVIEQLK